MKYALLFGLMAGIATVAPAASIRHEPLGDGLEAITITGDITSSDEVTFKRLAVQYDRAVVLLSSNGGELLPALEIGKAIHLREFGTFVADDDVCASACALIWVAGSKRLLAPRGRIGFHASYWESNGTRLESGVANALVGRYLTQLELSEKAIVFATSASPDSIRWLTAADKSTSGISFEILNTNKSEPVQSAPSSIGLGGWRVASVSNDSPGLAFVDTDTILRTGASVQFWEDSWWGKVAGGANRDVSLVRASCTEKSYSSVKIHFFYGDRYLESTDGDQKLDYARPGSVIFAVIESVCEGRYQTGAIADRAKFVARLRSQH